MSGVKPHLIAREKWLCAMESGEHVQCRGQFRNEYLDQDLNFKPSFCALGLAGELVDPGFSRYSIHEALELYKFTSAAESIITGWNDHNYLSFKQIATEIRKTPEIFFKED